MVNEILIQTSELVVAPATRSEIYYVFACLSKNFEAFEVSKLWSSRHLGSFGYLPYIFLAGLHNEMVDERKSSEHFERHIQVSEV